MSEDPAIIASCQQYFDNLWQQGGSDLETQQLDDWVEIVIRSQVNNERSNNGNGLGDFGAYVGAFNAPPTPLPSAVAEASQGFVKFLGEGNNRVPLTFETITEIKRAGCHWAVAYPASKRPRSVEDGAMIFIGRLTQDPNDILVFGRGIGIQHVPERDDATPEDIALRAWKSKWPCYIRVHDAEFVAGTMANGVSLNKLMSELGENSFASTKRNAASGEGNTDPRRAYRQQAAVELSAEGLEWLNERLQAAFDCHGKISQSELDKLDWPKVP